MNPGRKIFSQGLQHHPRFAAVKLLNFLHLFRKPPRGDGAFDQLLQKVGRTEVMIPLQSQDHRVNRLRQNAIANADAGRERLAVSAGVDHPIRKPAGGEGRFFIRALETQMAVGRVFQQVDGMPRRLFVSPQQLQRSRLFGESGRDPAGVLEIGDQIQHLHARQIAGVLQRLKNCRQSIKVEAILLHRNSPAIQPPALRDSQINKVSRILDQDDVSRIAERLGDQIQQLLGTVGDNHFFLRVGRSESPTRLARISLLHRLRN